MASALASAEPCTVKVDEDDVAYAQPILIAEEFDGEAVEAVAEPLPHADDADAIKVSLEELEIRADPDGVKRRVLALKDAISMGWPLRLRSDPAGRMEDVEALQLKDAESCTVLHHAATFGRVKAVREILAYPYVPGGPRAYCDLRNDAGNRPLDIAVRARHDACIDLLCSYDADDDVKDDVKDDDDVKEIGHDDKK